MKFYDNMFFSRDNTTTSYYAYLQNTSYKIDHDNVKDKKFHVSLIVIPVSIVIMIVFAFKLAKIYLFKMNHIKITRNPIHE